MRHQPSLQNQHCGSTVARRSEHDRFVAIVVRILHMPFLPMVEGFPDIFDTILGTIDREDLEKEWMAPDRHCWWEKGIPWVQELATGGLELPKHPTFKVNEFIE